MHEPPDVHGRHTVPTPGQNLQQRCLLPLTTQKPVVQACARVEGRSNSRILLPVMPIDCRMTTSIPKADHPMQWPASGSLRGCYRSGLTTPLSCRDPGQANRSCTVLHSPAVLHPPAVRILSRAGLRRKLPRRPVQARDRSTALREAQPLGDFMQAGLDRDLQAAVANILGPGDRLKEMAACFGVAAELHA